MKTILIIGDDQSDNNLAIKTIKKVGFTVILAKDCIEGLEKATGEKPDLVLMDYANEGMDPLTVIERLKRNKITKETPLMIMTGPEAKNNEKYKGILKGADDFISKPFDPKELMFRIKNNFKLEEYRRGYEKLLKRQDEVLASYRDIIYRLNVAAEYWEEETENHIRRISNFTKEIAAALGMDKDYVETIYHASAMHDVGKVGVPDAILSKKEKLMPDEREIMKTHTTVGARILSDAQSPFLQMSAEIALTHHENWNGGGYPAGLKGDKIPLAGRITNIVDQYDALRSERPFKRTLFHETAVNIITEGDGRTTPDDFDPDVLNAFVKSSDKLCEIYETYSDEK